MIRPRRPSHIHRSCPPEYRIVNHGPGYPCLNAVVTLRFLPILLSVIVLLAAPVRGAPILTPEAVAGIFSSVDNEEGQRFSPVSVTVLEGAFTAAGAREALISFTDTSQSDAAGIAEIWLMRFVDDDWEPIIKLAEADTAEFATTDLNGDGALEILTHTTSENRGYYVINRQLMHFVDGKPTKLLTFEGFDNTGWPDKGICVFDARFAFKDVNRDMILEVELTEFYDYCRKVGETSVFERRSERKTLFRPVVSSSGLITGIERLK